jgi:Ca2+-transporting ATPase
MADRALRVLACAARMWDDKPIYFNADYLEHDLVFVGLTGMIDPVRPEVKDAIVECRSAGIRPIMITGDHIDTASAIAKELGILKEGKLAITGSQLSEMDDEEYESKFRDISVYARVQPEHKTRIVRAFKSMGYICAMTGDGVNDAPSIKAADIGIGMGITGTDVTKGVADMVLADDNFATIVNAVEEGRKIYDNVRKVIQFQLSTNMSEVLTIFTSSLLGINILSAAHLLWINMVTDSAPGLALGMEKAESDLMTRKPRSSSESVFAHGAGIDMILQGIYMAALVVSSFFIGVYLEKGYINMAELMAEGSADGMTMAFLTCNFVEMFHAVSMRTQRGNILKLKHFNWWLLGAFILTTLLTCTVIYVPFLKDLFGVTAISFKEFAIAFGLAFSVLPVLEIFKACFRAAHHRRKRLREQQQH